MLKDTVSLLLLLVTAHCVSDLLLRPNNGSKSRSLHYFLTLHSGIHFIVSIILTIYFLSLQVIIIVTLISISHYLIDLFKAKVLRAWIQNGKTVDKIDQLMHFVAIFLVVYTIF